VELRLIREPSVKGATMGVLFVDGVFECFTLEDQIREQAGVPVTTWKVWGESAIPCGRYRVIITPSHRFKRPLPLVVDVPGFEGIRMHPGNHKGNTEGCILLGRRRAKTASGEPWVGESRLALETLFPRLERAPGELWLTIENPR
jgi:Family of unknown function (DUF5675)